MGGEGDAERRGRPSRDCAKRGNGMWPSGSALVWRMQMAQARSHALVTST